MELVDNNSPLRADGKATSLAIRLTPKGGRDAFESARVLADGRRVLVARVRAAPENGQANKALLALVADSLGCPGSAVSLVSGATSRLKIIRVESAYEKVIARLNALSLL
ncbi:MAG: DUF167 family protein [Rhabdaerophilum sp.]